jgi:hypothetical protein
MSWVITGKSVNKFLVMEAGTFTDGGYFAGLISHTADGSPTHALIVAPAATGATGTGHTLTTMLPWKTTDTLTAGTQSDFDGIANTAAMVAAGIANHPAAEFCVNLSIGGFADWYLPARWELDIAYFNFKPTTENNDASQGANPYSVPKRNSNFTTTVPARTAITAFQSGQGEAFINSTYYTSTEASGTDAWRTFFTTGNQASFGKNFTRRVRAFRRIAL